MIAEAIIRAKSQKYGQFSQNAHIYKHARIYTGGFVTLIHKGNRPFPFTLWKVSYDWEKQDKSEEDNDETYDARFARRQPDLPLPSSHLSSTPCCSFSQKTLSIAHFTEGFFGAWLLWQRGLLGDSVIYWRMESFWCVWFLWTNHGRRLW